MCHRRNMYKMNTKQLEGQSDYYVVDLQFPDNYIIRNRQLRLIAFEINTLWWIIKSWNIYIISVIRRDLRLSKIGSCSGKRASGKSPYSFNCELGWRLLGCSENWGLLEKRTWFGGSRGSLPCCWQVRQVCPTRWQKEQIGSPSTVRKSGQRGFW